MVVSCETFKSLELNLKVYPSLTLSAVPSVSIISFSVVSPVTAAVVVIVIMDPRA